MVSGSLDFDRLELKQDPIVLYGVGLALDPLWGWKQRIDTLEEGGVKIIRGVQCFYLSWNFVGVACTQTTGYGVDCLTDASLCFTCWCEVTCIFVQFMHMTAY